MSAVSGSPGGVARFEAERLWSSAVRGGGFVTCIGVGDNLAGDITAQTREALAEIDRCLALAGADKRDLVEVSIWLADIRHREAMNAVWVMWADPACLPARSCVAARLGDPRMLVEIRAVAART